MRTGVVLSSSNAVIDNTTIITHSKDDSRYDIVDLKQLRFETMFIAIVLVMLLLVI